jgi:hypothetical protein
MKEKAMRRWMMIGLTCVLATTAVTMVGCGSEEVTEASEAVSETYASEVLDTGYEGALDPGNQLALGTLKLEETEHAVTSEQAKTLLPLWQALQGGVTAEDEIGAVLKGIEGAMTGEQLAAVAEMQLTQDDMRALMEEQGFGPGGGFPAGGGDPDARATRQAEFGGGGGGGTGRGGEMPPEMATMRAQFENMSEEEREQMRATVQAGGGFPGGTAGGPGGGGRGVGFLIRPVVELLTERAG